MLDLFDFSSPAFRVPRGVESVRLATVQFQARAVKSFEEFVQHVEYFVDVAADYRVVSAAVAIHTVEPLAPAQLASLRTCVEDAIWDTAITVPTAIPTAITHVTL